MKTKKYKSKEKPLPKVEEPVATYGSTVANSNDVVISNLSSEALDDKPEGFDACYTRLKAEADARLASERRAKTVKREAPIKHDIPEGYMSLQQFEKALEPVFFQRPGPKSGCRRGIRPAS